LLKRFLERHANVLGFWSVVVLIALALVVAVALMSGRIG